MKTEQVHPTAKLTKLIRYETDPMDSPYWATKRVGTAIEFQLDAYPGWTFGTGGESNWETDPEGNVEFTEGWSNWGPYWETDPYVYFGVAHPHFDKIEGPVPNLQPSEEEKKYGDAYWYPPAEGLMQEQGDFNELMARLNKTIDDFGF